MAEQVQWYINNIFLEALRQFQQLLRPSSSWNSLLFFQPIDVPFLSDMFNYIHNDVFVNFFFKMHDLMIVSELKPSTQDKISLFCHVISSNVLSVHDVTNIYHVALILCRSRFANILTNKLQVEPAVMPPDMASWAFMADMVDNLSIEVHVALVGKYTDLQDSYLMF